MIKRNTFQKIFEHGSQRVYVLPTINSRFVFHAQFLKPDNKLQRLMIVMAYTMRKYRYFLSLRFLYGKSYMISDLFAQSLFDYGRASGNSPFYKLINRVTTRKCDGIYTILFL